MHTGIKRPDVHLTCFDTLQKPMETGSIVGCKRFLEEVHGVASLQPDGLDLFFELRPTGEAVFPGDHKLRIFTPARELPCDLLDSWSANHRPSPHRFPQIKDNQCIRGETTVNTLQFRHA